MLKTCDILIPLRFSTLIVQIILTFSVHYFMDKMLEDDDKDSLTVYCVLLYVCGLIEIILQFTGYTLFQNKLSLGQILLHFVTICLLIWSLFNHWKSSTLVWIWIFGGLFPLLLEGGGSFYTFLFYRKVLKL